MSTITAILTAGDDGSLHLPLPSELQHRRVKITATIEAADEPSKVPPQHVVPVATPEMIARREKAFAALRRLHERNPNREITDPVAWHREIRKVLLQRVQIIRDGPINARLPAPSFRQRDGDVFCMDIESDRQYFRVLGTFRGSNHT